MLIIISTQSWQVNETFHLILNIETEMMHHCWPQNDFWPSTLLHSDPGHKADGAVVTRSEEQPEQIRQLHPEDADCYSTQRRRLNRAGQDGVNNKAFIPFLDKGPVCVRLLSSSEEALSSHYNLVIFSEALDFNGCCGPYGDVMLLSWTH